jgi:hypothetical protein
MATVIQNIRRVRAKVMGGDTIFTDDLTKKAINAIVAGMRDNGQVTDEWKALMEIYAVDDQTQLDRLCGKDPVFMAGDWARECLAYIAGNSTCGSDTATMTGTERNFNTQMRDKLELFEASPTPDLANVPKCPE